MYNYVQGSNSCGSIVLQQCPCLEIWLKQLILMHKSILLSSDYIVFAQGHRFEAFKICVQFIMKIANIYKQGPLYNIHIAFINLINLISAKLLYTHYIMIYSPMLFGKSLWNMIWHYCYYDLWNHINKSLTLSHR